MVLILFIAFTAQAGKSFSEKGNDLIERRNPLGISLNNTPSVKVYKTSSSVMKGGEVTLTWKTENARELILEGYKELPLSGKMTIKPEETTTYVFKAVKNKKVKIKKVTVYVESPEIDYFTGPDMITDEGSGELKWSTNGAEYVRIEGISDSLPRSGSVWVTLDTTKTFILTAHNNYGYSATAEHTSGISYVENLSNPDCLIKGKKAIVTFKYKNCSHVTMEGDKRNYLPIDTIQFKPDTTSSYTLNIYRNNGEVQKETFTITVVVPKIQMFKGPKTINQGETVLMEWKISTNALLSIVGVAENLPPKGNISVSPDKTTTYTMELVHEGVVEQAHHTIEVVKRSFVKGIADVSQVDKDMRIDFEIFATDMSGYPKEIKLYVLAVDEKGNFISNLAPPYGSSAMASKYFRSVVEKVGKEKASKVKGFSVREVHETVGKPFDINLTQDYSGSMSGTVQILEKATKKFIQKKHDDDRVSITRFSDVLNPEVPLTADKNDILKQVSFKGTCDGGTALYAGADEGLMSLEGSENQKQQILFTDGYENSSFMFFGKRAVFAQQVALKACKGKTRIHTVAFGENVNQPLLKYLSMVTGGNYYNLVNSKDIEAVLEELPRINRNYYVISYKPVGLEGERQIDFVYFNNQELKKTSRGGYVGQDFNLSTFEFGSVSYWNQPANNWGGLSPVSPPQAVAYFDFNESSIKDKYKDRIETYKKYLEENSGASIVVFGHTDNVGGDTDCDALSLKRAESVKNYLSTNGIDPARIILEACGKKSPVWAVEDEKWKAQENRRVEILLVE